MRQLVSGQVGADDMTTSLSKITSLTSDFTSLTAATADEQFLKLWLSGKSPHTADYYQRSAQRFLLFVSKPLHLVSFVEVQAFALHLESLGLAQSSRRSILSAVRSLLSFAHKVGLLSINVGSPLKLPPAPDTLAQRIPSPLQVQVMIALELNPRNRAILMLLYYGGLRVSELCRLTWGHLQEQEGRGQVMVEGKGSKVRTILLPPHVWKELRQLPPRDSAPHEPVFRSRNHSHQGHLHRYQVDRIVKAAAARAGLSFKISPHCLRHAHASHALERGAKIHLVQATLGHSSVAVTSRYLHARPDDSSGLYLPT